MLKLLGVAALYGFTSWLVRLYFGEATIFFLASGLGLASLLLGGRRYLFAIWAGAFLANFFSGSALWSGAAMAGGSALASWCGAALIQRDSRFDAGLPTLRDIVRLYVWGGLVGSLVGAGIGTTTLWLADVVSRDSYVSSLANWWMGDALGVILLTPLILLWLPKFTNPRPTISVKFLAESALILGLTLLAAGIIFLEWLHGLAPASLHLWLNAIGRGYWMFLFIAWAAVRLGASGTTLALLLVAAAGITGTHQGTGMFANDPEVTRLINYWIYTVTLSVVGPMLATYIEASKKIAKALASSDASVSQELKKVMAALDQHAIVAATDVHGRIISMNDKFCEISGYAKEELLGQNHKMLNSGLHPKDFFKQMYRTIATGSSWSGEICNRAKDGSVYWLHTTISPFIDAHGKPTMYIAIRSDITARKQVEIKLAEREEIYRSIVTQAGEGIALIDPETQAFAEFNDAACDCLGYSRDEFSSLRLDDIATDVDATSLTQSVQRIVQDGHARFETHHRHKSGSLRNIHISARVIMISARPYIVVIMADITRRKANELELLNYRDQLEQMVQEQTRELRHSADLAKSALSELDRQKFVLDRHAAVSMSDAAGHITYGNSKFSEISGYARSEFIGQDHKILNSGHHPKGFFKAMYEALGRGEVWHAEVCNRSKDGRLYWLDTTVAAFAGDDNNAHEYIAVRTDITDRKKAEKAAHVANLAKSEFLSNMSHEIRTPMNGVVGMIDILQETELTPRQRSMLDTVHQSSLALLAILNDILDLSKIEAGKLEIEDIPTHLREVAEGVAQLMVNTSTTQLIDLSVFVSPELPRWIVCDPTRLRQVLLNLLGNAVKFSVPRESKTARVQLRVEPCSLAQGGAGIRLRVIDSGIGMSEEVVGKLFQPFSQADASTARQFGGTGLGLSITQRLVDLLQGRISVRSILGEGSEFAVELPLRESTPGRTLAAEPRLAGIHVLGVFEDSGAAQDLGAYCMAAGAEFTAVADLAAARRQLQQSPAASGTTVVALGLNVTASTREIELPATVGVLRFVRRGSSSPVKDVTVPARPVLYHELIQGVALACSRLTVPHAQQQVERWSMPVRSMAPSVEQARHSKQLILLAEDNETNRDVLQEQLRLLGYAAELAEDGAVALQMWRSGGYALLLTDCHMPNMDGFELTAAIRQAEAPGARLPIVAITANAMQGEAQRCIERGMDDYLAKPLRLNELGLMLTKWLPLVAQSTVNLTPEIASSALAIWDATTLTQLAGDNPAMHQRLLEKFILNAQQQVVAIGAAAAAGQTSGMADVAHMLKSSARTVGALALGELCQQLETAGRAGDGPNCGVLVEYLDAAFCAASDAITKSLA